MSSLISSFIIEPVIRQARRLSGSLSRGETADDEVIHVASPPAGTIATEDGDCPCSCGESRRVESTVSHAASGVQLASSSALRDQTTEDAVRDVPGYRRRQPRQLTAEHPTSDPGSSFTQDLTLSTSTQTQRNRSLTMDSLGSDGFRALDNGSASSMEGPSLRDSTVDEAGLAATDPTRHLNVSGALPEDDGMSVLRTKLHEIREMRASGEDKARQMHALMTETYRASQMHSPGPKVPSTNSTKEKGTALSKAQPRPGSSHLSVSMSIDTLNSYQVSEVDLKPVYRPSNYSQNRREVTGEDVPVDRESPLEEPVRGCQHYKRNVKIQCYDCHRWYPCRHCHNEVEEHSLKRQETRNMLCMLCGTPQPASQSCRQCGERAACYYCDICKFWDDDSMMKTYHCNDCGLCRRGEGLGKDFVHCKKCNVCISIQIADTHRCIERATECDCPICGEWLFTSSMSIASLPCGHYMHRKCYDQYMQTAYKCPVCNKSAINMEVLWRKLDRQIEAQPMPDPFAETTVLVSCNDCSAKSCVSYHWLGNKCVTCDSYNTSELQVYNRPSANSPDLSVQPVAPAADTSQRSQHRQRQPLRPMSSSGSYFLAAQERPRTSSSMTEQSLFSRYQVFERMNRSLSPLRNYLGVRGEEVSEAISRIETVDFWGADGQFLSGGEDGSESGSADEDNSEDSELEDDIEEEDGDEGEEELDGINLRGHL